MILNIRTRFTCLILIVIAMFYSCSVINSQFGAQYEITMDFIKGKSPIERFQIAVLKKTELNEQGYPLDNNELERYCCFSDGDNSARKIFFQRANDGYQWTVCTPDLKYVEVDSLINLSEEEKRQRIGGSKSPVAYNTMPFKFESDKVYHLFGLEGIEGSYYLYFSEKKEFIVKYFDGGPF